jgi:phosphate transport system substrate-binding protein
LLKPIEGMDMSTFNKVAAYAASVLIASSSLAADPIRITGSDTVHPVLVAASDQFLKSNPATKFAYDARGTSQGFSTLCEGRADVALASRRINEKELATCRSRGITFGEVPVAWDAVAVIANRNDGWLRDISAAELRKIWGTESTQRSMGWNELRSSYPNTKIVIYGLDAKSGTREFFTAAVAGNSAAARTDYQMFSEHGDVIANVAKTPGSIGYVSLPYYLDRASQVAALAVGAGGGAVLPSAQTILNDQYGKLSRVVYAYVAKASYAQRPEVREFVDFFVAGAGRFVQYARLVPLTERNYQDALAKMKAAPQ